MYTYTYRHNLLYHVSMSKYRLESRWHGDELHLMHIAPGDFTDLVSLNSPFCEAYRRQIADGKHRWSKSDWAAFLETSLLVGSICFSLFFRVFIFLDFCKAVNHGEWQWTTAIIAESQPHNRGSCWIPSLQKRDARAKLSAHPQSSRRRSQTSPAQDYACHVYGPLIAKIFSRHLKGMFKSEKKRIKKTAFTYLCQIKQ